MTISSTVRTAGPYPGNGVAVAFSFGFKVFTTAQVVVQQTDDATDEIAELELGTDYTVALNSDQNANPGGVVTMLAALPLGQTLNIGDLVDSLQLLSLHNLGAFSAKDIENALDKLTILHLNSVGFLRAPEVGGIDELPFPADRKDFLLAFDPTTGEDPVMTPFTVTQVASAVAAAYSAGASTADAVMVAGLGTGSQDRSVQAMLRPNINVLTYVAPGEDPAVDIAPALQRAVDFIGTLATGLFTASGMSVRFPTVDESGAAIDYLIDSDVEIPSTIDGIGLCSDDFGKGTRVVVSAGARIIVGDQTDVATTYGFSVGCLMFVAEDDSAPANVCLEMHSCSKFNIQNSTFSGFWTGILGYHINRGVIGFNFFWNSARTVNAAKAGIRLYGTATGTGGGLHVVHNEFIGNANDKTMMEHGVLFHTVDGLYLDSNHYVKLVNGWQGELLGTADNSWITDVRSTREYFDDRAVGGYGARITGTLTAGGRCQDIEIDAALYANGDAENCVLVDIEDDGTFTAGGGKAKNFRFLHSTFKQATDTAIRVKGTASAKLEVYGVKCHDSYFEDNNGDGAALASCMVIEAESVSWRDNTVAEDAVAAPLLVKATMSLAASGKPSWSSGGNDYSKTNCSGADPYDISTISGSLVQMDPDIEPGPGQVISRQLKGATDSRSVVILWSHTIHADGQAVSLDAKVQGCSTSGTQGASVAIYRVHCDAYRVAGSDSVMQNNVVETSFENIAANAAPVKLTLLDGTAWVAAAPVTAGDMCKSGGNVYLVIVTGNLDGATPPSHTTGVAANGTAVLAYVSAVGLNTLAILVSGPAATTMKWLVPEFNFGAVP